MALLGSRPPVPSGQLTSTVYAHLREGHYDDAIQILEYELQVCCLTAKALITTATSLITACLAERCPSVS